jgi:hypothetical protein
LGKLEDRRLLAAPGPAGVWIGQDGHDLANLTSTLGPDGVQDIHIALIDLPADETIVAADILPLGGGEWRFNGPYGPVAAALVRTPGATTADLYLDPYQTDSGRSYWIVLDYGDHTSAGFWVVGGAVNANLRMPQDQLQVRWIGQDGQDLTGLGPDVGPDGIQDVHLTLSQLWPNVAIQSVTVSGPPGISWQYGLNPGLLSNAELVPNAANPSQAELYFSPDRDLNGQTLTVALVYADGKTDSATVVAGHSDPNLRRPRPQPVALTWNTITASWVGQDGLNLTGPGDVHVALGKLPAARTIVSAVLSDEAGVTWVYNSSGIYPDPLAPLALPMGFRRWANDPTRADVGFPPVRNESGATLTLRLVLHDGTMLATTMAGGSSDPGLRAPGPAPTSVIAHPGDDLNALANRFGTVQLSAGTYALSQPLVLNQPVTIAAGPGVTLLFSQRANDPAWTAAIKINSGHTTLSGFAVRFAGPIRWADSISYGPAVIGSTDNDDTGPSASQVKVDITLTHLDLMSPPATSSWEIAPSLIRLASALSGQITDNVLKGGTTEMLNGPWTIVGNDYQGTVPGTFTYSAFGFHATHDLLLAGNTVEPVGPSGKTWRFLVMTVKGFADVIQDNTVVGVGPRDSDTVPNPNASEVVLTEAYSLHFEGMPAAISPDGRVLQIPAPQGLIAQTGDVVSILSGPDAGQWRMLEQAISPTAYLLDSPLPAGQFAISISTGFVDETYKGNTIDNAGSSAAAGMVLVGNHFGTQVLDNTFRGGKVAFLIAAAPTESPDIWGWSHAPVLGVVVEGNTLEDTLAGGLLDVQHNAAVKSNQGRVYFSGTLAGNTAVWTADFLAQRLQSGTTASPTALMVGDSLSLDPGELLLSAQGNRVQGPDGFRPGASLQVAAGTVNGQAMVNQGAVLPSVPPPGAPTGLRLVDDTGLSATDGLTNDGRLRCDTNTLPTAVGYEYRLSGSGTYQPVASPAAFLPAGLVQGPNTVFVRAFDATGRRGSDASLTFTYDTVPPGPVTGLVALASGQVRFQPVAAGDVYAYRIGGSTAYVPIGSATSFLALALLTGPGTVQVHAIDPAGNVGPDTITLIVPAAVPVSRIVRTGPTSSRRPPPLPRGASHRGLRAARRLPVNRRREQCRTL